MEDDDKDELEDSKQSIPVAVAVLQAKVRLMSKIMVTKWEFTPVKIILYGLVGLVLTSVFAAILKFVLTNH